jgi:hypothetical protein
VFYKHGALKSKYTIINAKIKDVYNIVNLDPWISKNQKSITVITFTEVPLNIFING